MSSCLPAAPDPHAAACPARPELARALLAALTHFSVSLLYDFLKGRFALRSFDFISSHDAVFSASLILRVYVFLLLFFGSLSEHMALLER